MIIIIIITFSSLFSVFTLYTLIWDEPCFFYYFIYYDYYYYLFSHSLPVNCIYLCLFNLPLNQLHI